LNILYCYVVIAAAKLDFAQNNCWLIA